MTTPYYSDGGVTLHHGDCLDVLATLPDNSIDSVVTDPPYGLANTTPAQVTDTLMRWANGERDYLPSARGFMGASWDGFVPPVAVWDECLRVLKPGGHMAVFAGSRTQDLMGLAIRLAGFDLRDSVAWLYGSGFPKSLDVSKAIDKRGGNSHLADRIGAAIKAARVARGWTTGQADRHFCGGSTNWTWYEGRKGVVRPPTPDDFARIATDWPELAAYAEMVAEADREVVTYGKSGAASIAYARESPTVYDVTAPATPDAERWQGWGTALKPGHEPIILARKPFPSTVAANVQEWGTGALNIDGCRIGTEERLSRPSGHTGFLADGVGTVEELKALAAIDGKCPNGRSARATLARWESGHGAASAEPSGRWPVNVALDETQAEALDQQSGESVSKSGGMSGTISRGGIMNNTGEPRTDERGGHDDSGGASRFFYTAKADSNERPRINGVAHPTVKPLGLIRWLVRLITPPGGTVLDPFAGSGTTGEACLLEGFSSIIIEREADYLPLIRHRITRRRDPIANLRDAGEDLGLFGEQA